MQSNKVLLLGYVGRHISTRKCINGSKRAAIRLATHYSNKKASGEKTRNTIWHNVVAWDQRAEYAERSFVKGSKILVEGYIEYRSFTLESGETCNTTFIRAQSLTNLDR